MKIERLRVRRVNGEEVAVFQRRGAGSVELASAIERVRRDLSRWVEHGVDDLAGEIGQRVPRRTVASDPAFLTRAAEQLRTYGYRVFSEVTETRANTESIMVAASWDVRIVDVQRTNAGPVTTGPARSPSGGPKTETMRKQGGDVHA
jgi:hypothetical protein